VTNASVNPVRSTGPTIIAGGWALEQLWLFWAAPLVAAVLAGWAYPGLAGTARHDAYEPASRGSEDEERLRADHPVHAR
jgi:aquaporin Z